MKKRAIYTLKWKYSLKCASDKSLFHWHFILPLYPKKNQNTLPQSVNLQNIVQNYEQVYLDWALMSVCWLVMMNIWIYVVVQQS